MTSQPDDDFARLLASAGEGSARAPQKARLLPMDEGATASGAANFRYTAAPRPWLRLGLQVATMLVAGAVGWYSAGSGLGGTPHPAVTAEIARLSAQLAAADDVSRRRVAADDEQKAGITALRESMAAVARDLTTLRTAQARDDSAARMAKLAERLDKLERQAELPTASIAPVAPLPAVAPRPPVAKAASSLAGPAAVRPLRAPPPGGYVLREVYDGGAIVHGHRGPVEVWPGAHLPGAGKVQAILRRNGQWVVTTTGGEIDSEGY